MTMLQAIILLGALHLTYCSWDPLVSNLFSGGKKHINITICDGRSPLLKSSVPPRPVCDYHKISIKNKPIPVLALVYKQDLTLAELPIFYCKREVVTQTCFKNFFGVEYREVRRTNKRVNKWECHNLVVENRLNLTQEETIGEVSPLDCRWMATTMNEVSVTKVATSIGYFSRTHNTVHHGFPVGGGCHADDGECSGEHGAVYWDMRKVPERCDLLLSRVLPSSVFFQDSLQKAIVQDFHRKFRFTISNFSPVFDSLCSGNRSFVYRTDEGTALGLMMERHLVTLEQMAQEEPPRIINSQEGTIVSSLESLNLSISLDIPAINSALQKIKEAIEDNTHSLDQRLCLVDQDLWDMAWSSRKLNPSGAVKMLLRRDDVVGHFVGSSIYYRMCVKTPWYQLERQGPCGEMWRLASPVNFCLDGVARLAMSCPDTCGEPSPSFLFQVNATHSVDLAIIPLRLISVSSFFHSVDMKVPTTDITDSILYSSSEISQGVNMIHIVDAIQKRVESLEGYTTKKQENGTTTLYMLGSPGFYTGLGLAAGKVSTLGAGLWASICTTSSVIWIVLIYVVARWILSSLQTLRAPLSKVPASVASVHSSSSRSSSTHSQDLITSRAQYMFQMIGDGPNDNTTPV